MRVQKAVLFSLADENSAKAVPFVLCTKARFLGYNSGYISPHENPPTSNAISRTTAMMSPLAKLDLSMARPFALFTLVPTSCWLHPRSHVMCSSYICVTLPGVAASRWAH